MKDTSFEPKYPKGKSLAMKGFMLLKGGKGKKGLVSQNENDHFGMQRGITLRSTEGYWQPNAFPLDFFDPLLEARTFEGFKLPELEFRLDFLAEIQNKQESINKEDSKSKQKIERLPP